MSKPEGWASDDLKYLCDCVRARYDLLLSLLERVKVAVEVIETARDEARQRYYHAIGVSETLHSKHLPQPPKKLSLAIDLCPASYLRMKFWNPEGDEWSILGGKVGEAGLLWGGAWRTFKDKPHCYLESCECERIGRARSGRDIHKPGDLLLTKRGPAQVLRLARRGADYVEYDLAYPGPVRQTGVEYAEPMPPRRGPELPGPAPPTTLWAKLRRGAKRLLG